MYLFLDQVFIFSNLVHKEQNHMWNSHTELGQQQKAMTIVPGRMLIRYSLDQHISQQRQEHIL